METSIVVERERIVTRSLKRENRFGKIDKNNDWYTFIGGTLALLVLIGGTVFWDPVVNQAAARAADFTNGYSDWCSDWMSTCDSLLPESSQLSSQLLCVYRDQAKGRAHYMFAQDALVGTSASENWDNLTAQFTSMTSTALASVAVGANGTGLLPLVNGLYVDCEKNCTQATHLMDGESFLFLLFHCVGDYNATYVNPTTYGSKCSLDTTLAASLTVFSTEATAVLDLHCRLRVNWLLNAAVMRVHIFQYCSFPIFQGLFVTFGAMMLLMLGVNAMILTHRPSSLIVDADKMDEQYKKLGIYEPEQGESAVPSAGATVRSGESFSLRTFLRMRNAKELSTRPSRWSRVMPSWSTSSTQLTSSLQELEVMDARKKNSEGNHSTKDPVVDQEVLDMLW